MKCCHKNMEVRHLRVFENVLLLEPSVNVHRIVFTLSIFKRDKYLLYRKKPVLMEVRDPPIHWNNNIKVRSCSVLHITCL
jgi:hypothetical protein